MITGVIVGIFLIGYAFIAMESTAKINKSAIALLMCVLCWVCYMMGAQGYLTQMFGVEFEAAIAGLGEGSLSSAISSFVADNVLIPHLGSTAETVFFLLGAMTIVEVVDYNGGFNFVRERLKTHSKRRLLWQMVFITFFLSAVLDNLTTSLVMIAVLRKLVPDHKDRMIYAAMVILAANAGGAFSPIGDVTTIMLWIKGAITSLGVIKELFIPSVVSVIIPTFVLSLTLKGTLGASHGDDGAAASHAFSKAQRTAVFVIGVVGLVMVPVFRSLTGLPPFMGILFVLGLLWVLTELFIRYEHKTEGSTAKERVSKILHKIDLSTILFFLGILMAVAVLSEIGVLSSFGKWLEEATDANAYLVTGIIGVVSSVIDNVPLVAGCMGMYEIAPAATADPALMMFVPDGTFWQLLAYCAGVGGSMLIIGSAAGVVVMGLEKITFGWYLRHISLVTFIGYLAGIAIYWLEKTYLF